MVIEIVFNNEIQIILYFQEEKYVFVYIIGLILSLTFKFIVLKKY
jgi:hypothetical protein